MDNLSTTFAALADPTRRAILAQLATGSATVTELAAPFDISLPAISRHLKVLEQAGLIRRQVEAQKRRCHLQQQRLAAASDWIETYRNYWQQRFDALEDYLDQAHQEDEIDE